MLVVLKRKPVDCCTIQKRPQFFFTSLQIKFGGLKWAIRVVQNWQKQSVFGKCVILSNGASNGAIDPESGKSSVA